MQFSMLCSSFLAGTIILRNGSSFEECSIVRVVLLVILLLNSVLVKYRLFGFVVGELEIALLKAGTAKCDLSEIIFKYIHEPSTSENSIDKNGN